MTPNGGNNGINHDSIPMSSNTTCI